MGIFLPGPSCIVTASDLQIAASGTVSPDLTPYRGSRFAEEEHKAFQ